MKKSVFAVLAVFLLAVLFVGGVSAEKVIAGVDDLEGAKIGVQQGTTGDIYATDYEGDEAGTTIARYLKGADAVQALKTNKIDCVIIDNLPAESFIAKNPDLMILDGALDDELGVETYAICVKKDSPLTAQINDALAKLEADGTLDQIMLNYIGDAAGTQPYVKKDVERPNGVLVMATNAEFPPYEYREGDAIVGIDADIAQAICDELGYELKITDMAFDAIIVAVQTGKADVGIAGMSVTEDRLKNVDFSEPYTSAKQVIIVKNPEAAASPAPIAGLLAGLGVAALALRRL
ncbi:MAG: transporter substrate-binding domain-containing protein [Methanocorpusculaceae archaeon]|nr:transporter substrate-binding domain-containing protein [Methanocorpusculaceae archaeon]